MNNLICWQEKRTKKWDMIKDKDRDAFLLNLLKNDRVDKHTIFIIPASSIFSGLWLWKYTHKSTRVDFYRFFEEYGTKYVPPKVNEEDKKTLHEINEENGGDNTKYGWISPDGRYFHCGYQGHSNLAYNICFGLAETDNPELYLENHGWCKIYKSLFEDGYHVYVGNNFVITDPQMKTLIKLKLDNAKDLSKMLVKDRNTQVWE